MSDLIEMLRSYANTRRGEVAELIAEVADVLEYQPRVGRWIKGTMEDPCYYICNVCGRLVDVKEDFCPSCGSKMEK